MDYFWSEKNLLPLSIQVVIDFLVSDGHHDNEDPEKNHADEELVNYPHGNHGRLQVFGPLSP